MGDRPARGSPERPDHARGRRQDRRRPARRGTGERRRHAARLGRPRIRRRGRGPDPDGTPRGPGSSVATAARRPRPAQPGRGPRDDLGARRGRRRLEVRVDRDRGDGPRRMDREQRPRQPAAAWRPSPCRLAAPRGRRMARRRPTRPCRRRAPARWDRVVRYARRRGRVPGDADWTSPFRGRSASPARSPSWSTRSRRIGGRPVSRSNPAARSWLGRVGSLRASCTSGSAAAGRSSSMPG